MLNLALILASGGLIAVIVIVVLLVVVVFAFIGMYNKLVQLRNRVKEAWAQIDVQLKRRYDLLPNLVETVKGYASHENETLTKVIEARNQAMQALKEVNNMVQQSGGIPVGSGGGAPGGSMPSPMGGGGGGGAEGGGMGALINAEGLLMGAMKNMQITVEQYPDLKANQNFMQLQEELVSTENRIAFARQHYNDEVRQYNTKREVIPSNIVASMGGFQPAAYFEIRSEEREAVQVDFGASS